MATILCIDDEADIRRDIAEELRQHGYTVIEAASGEAALDALADQRPDLILCDITMPEMSGFDLLKEVRRNHPRHAETPFIFLSALAARDDVLSGLDRGADDYLTKPVDFDLLLAKVSSSLRQMARMAEKKQQEQVTLYRALVSEEKPEAVRPTDVAATDRGLRVVVVGPGDHDLDEVAAMLKAQGCAVTRITSGIEYVNRVDELRADLTLIAFQSTDMQAPMIAKFARRQAEGGLGPLVLLWPAAFDGLPQSSAARYLDHVLKVPVSVEDLMAKVDLWTAQAPAAETQG